MPYTYENTIDLKKVKETEGNTEYYLRLVELGLTPHQIFKKDLEFIREPLPPKPLNQIEQYDYNIIGGNLSTQINAKVFTSYITENGDSNLFLIFSDYSRKEVKIHSNVSGVKVDVPSESSSCHGYDKFKHQIFPLSSYLCFYEEELENNKTLLNFNTNYFISKAFAFYDKGNYLALGGHFGGRIILITPKEAILVNKDDSQNDTSPVTSIKINKAETTAFCGTELGSIVIYDIKEKDKWKFVRNFNCHEGKINSIYYHNVLHCFGSCSDDGYAHIFLFPSLKLVTSVYERQKIDNIFLSVYPLASFVLYFKKEKLFKVYSINGNFICQKEQNENGDNSKEEQKSENENVEIGGLISPMIYKDALYSEYLLYGNTKGVIIIRKLFRHII